MTKLTIIRNDELIHPHGFDIVIRNNNDVKNRENQSGWKPLFDAMWENLSPEQKAHVTHNNKNGKPFVFYNEVCDCYIPDKQDDGAFNYNTGDSDKRCICGVEIKYEYMIMNILTRITYKIGSTCIGHWNFKIAQQLKRDKQLTLDPESTFCPDCNRKNNLKRCGCENKILQTKSVCFKILKYNAAKMGRFDVIEWGKYKDAKLTYFQILVSENIVLMNYVRYITDNQNNTYMIKKNLDKFIEYKKIIDSQDSYTLDDDFEEQIQKKIDQSWISGFTLRYQSNCIVCKCIIETGTSVKFKKNNNSKKLMFKCNYC